MEQITFNYTHALNFFNESTIFDYQLRVDTYHNKLHHVSGEESKYLGWVDWPNHYPKTEEFRQIKQAAVDISNQSDVLLVIGVGGSYLGARAVISLLQHTFYNQLPKSKRNTPEIYFLGHNLSATYLTELLELIDGKHVSVNVISKSGTTTEPALTFRIINDYLEKKYGVEGARQRIYITTDEHDGALRALANDRGYQSFHVPNNIGGRYSVLTAVGLLPIAVSGICIDELLEGAQAGYIYYNTPSLVDNPCYQYAVIRNILYSLGKTIEILAYFEPKLFFMGEWWKQLFGESEGKDGKGIFPTSMHFTRDLHSIGQYIQDGLRNIFETVLFIETSSQTLSIPQMEKDYDSFNFLQGTHLNEINKHAFTASLLAHKDGGIPNLVIELPELTPYYVGQLIYFFEKACALSGFILEVNPFDQPGVEAYKNNLFTLLGKPGYEIKL